MNALDTFYSTPWALTPGKFRDISDFLEARARGVSIEFEAAAPKEPGIDEAPYAIVNGVAVMPAFGVLSKRANFLTRFSGGTSTDLFRRDLAAAIADPSVRAIVFDVDSPGGSVAGTAQLADAIFAARGKKPMTAVVNEQMASGALWIFTAADRVVTAPTGTIGSLGVMTAIRDFSGAEEKAGVKTTFITSGKLKATGHGGPLTSEQHAAVQAGVDSLHAQFVEAVARNLAMPADRVQALLGDSRVVTGKQAVEMGVAHAVGTLDSAIAEYAAILSRSSTLPPLPGASHARIEDPHPRRQTVHRSHIRQR